MEPIEPQETPEATLALKFAYALTQGNFDAAHSMLSSSIQHQSPANSQLSFEEMTSYWDSPADSIRVLDLNEVTEGNIHACWVYVAIESLACSGLEAVNVQVMRHADRHVITRVIWGRP